MTNALSLSIERLIAECLRLGARPGADLSRMIGDVVTLSKAEERERCLDILMRVGIVAMEAGHTNVGKYIAAASTQIRASK